MVGPRPSPRLGLLANVLGLAPATIERVLYRAGVKHPNRCSLRELAAVLRGESVARARAEARALRMRSRGSRYWIAGYLHLLAEWHLTKNGDLFPDEVSYGSPKRIWWKCSKGPDHEWCASATNRTSRPRGCPFCANRAVSVTNSLASLAPEMAR